MFSQSTPDISVPISLTVLCKNPFPTSGGERRAAPSPAVISQMSAVWVCSAVAGVCLHCWQEQAGHGIAMSMERPGPRGALYSRHKKQDLWKLLPSHCTSSAKYTVFWHTPHFFPPPQFGILWEADRKKQIHPKGTEQDNCWMVQLEPRTARRCRGKILMSEGHLKTQVCRLQPKSRDAQIGAAYAGIACKSQKRFHLCPRTFLPGAGALHSGACS